MAMLSSDLQDYLQSSRSGEDRVKNFFSLDAIRSPRIATRWFGGHEDQEPLVEVTETGDGIYWFGGGHPSSAFTDCFPSLSKKQRIVGFFACILMGVLCLVLASLYLPVLALKARKFALLYSLGSLFLVSSFSMLWGPVNHIKHLFSLGRLPFTVAYFGTMITTLYFAMAVRSTPLTVIFAVTQIFALVWYVVSYIPGGQTGLKFLSKIFSAAVTRSAARTLPI